MADRSTEPSTFGVSGPMAIFIGVLLAAVVLFAFWGLPPLLVSEQKLSEAQVLKAENDVRTAALQVIAGLVVAAGLLLTARSVALTARSIEVSRQSLEVNRESQVTE